VLPIGLTHVLEGGDDVARPNVTTAQAGRSVVDAGDAIDLLLPVGPEHGVAEGGLDLAGQVVAGRGERIVHALEDGKGLAALQRLDDLPAGERSKDADVEAAGRDALVAQIIDGRLG